MGDFVTWTKKTVKFVFKYFWAFVLLILACYFLYQGTFSYSSNEVEVVANNELKKEDDVIFVVIEESFLGQKDKGFKSLKENLESFKFDEKEGLVYFKHKNHLPYYIQENDGSKDYQFSNTKIIVVYDKGKDSFERYTEVVSLSTFPYTYYSDNKKLFTVEGINSDGTVFLNFNEKTIKLSKDDKYSDMAFEDFQLNRTSIKNYGIFNKKQFKELKTENQILREQQQKEKEAREKAEAKEKAVKEGKTDTVELPNINDKLDNTIQGNVSE